MTEFPLTLNAVLVAILPFAFDFWRTV